VAFQAGRSPKKENDIGTGKWGRKSCGKTEKREDRERTGGGARGRNNGRGGRWRPEKEETEGARTIAELRKTRKEREGLLGVKPPPGKPLQKKQAAALKKKRRSTVLLMNNTREEWRTDIGGGG